MSLENRNSLQSRSIHEALLDAVSLGFTGVDYTPLTPDDSIDEVPDEPLTLSGSSRYTNGYDSFAGCRVEAVETISLLKADEGVSLPDWRLEICWDNGQEITIVLDHKIILYGQDWFGETSSEKYAELCRTAINGLMACVHL